VIGGDMNGYVSIERRGYERIHGGSGFGEENEPDGKVLDFALSYNFAVANIYLGRKKSIT